MVTGDDSSHSQGQSGKRLLLASRGHPARSPTYQGSCIDSSYLSHTLDLNPDLPFPISHVTIQLLVNDISSGKSKISSIKNLQDCLQINQYDNKSSICNHSKRWLFIWQLGSLCGYAKTKFYLLLSLCLFVCYGLSQESGGADGDISHSAKVLTLTL